MSHRPMTVRSVSAFAAVVLLAVFAAPPLGAADHKPTEEKVKKGPMAEHMETIDDAMGKLRRTIRKAELNADSLKLLQEMQQEAVVCKGMVPPMAAKIPEAQRQQFLANFRKDMDRFVIALSNMEIAILDGENGKAQDIYKTLKTLEDEGHDKYKEQEETPKK
jgi:soluble cytochrome b562